jgi:hypothetical protein
MIALAIICMSVTAAHASAPASLPSFSATYTVRYGVLRGEMKLRLNHLGSGYLYETSLRPLGVVSWFRSGEIREVTELAEIAGAMRPVNYSATDTIARPTRNTRYQFDQPPGHVSGEYKLREIEEPMRPGGHNRISVHVAVMLALQSDSDISEFSVFDRARWKDFQFETFRNQAVKTPFGDFDTVEIRYASTDDGKSWSLYCATSLNYVPVMIVYREGGKVKSRAELTDYRPGEPGAPEQ